ncbi:hypothetical protein BC059799_5546 [Bacillus cereus NVH0597-99]|nr:hypothetical protein BC059799_5546 [Bacillus cereus NVH0597-99]
MKKSKYFLTFFEKKEYIYDGIVLKTNLKHFSNLIVRLLESR